MTVDADRADEGDVSPRSEPHATDAEAAAKARTAIPSVQVRIAWGATTIDVAHLDPPRRLTWGELARSCEPGAIGATSAIPADTRIVELDAEGWPCVMLDEASPREVPDAASERCAAPCAPVVDDVVGRRLLAGQRVRVSLGGVDVWLFAIDPAPITKIGRRPLERRVKWVAAGVLAAHALVLGGLALRGEPPRSAEPSNEQLAEMQRLLKVAAERGEDEPTEPEGSETGVRARGEEGSLGGGATSRRYGVRGPTEDPHIARQQALRESAEFGMIGLLDSGAGGDPNAPAAPWGRDGGADALSARGNLWGAEIGEAYGGGGLGTSGIGTIGHGAGTGTAQGFGNGAGRGASARAPAHTPATPSDREVEAPIDPNGRFATTYRPGRGHLASFEAALARGVLPADAREVVADVGASAPPALAAPKDAALAWRADLERASPAPAGGPSHLRISLRSAEASAGRPHLSVHLVVDTSGSMEGEAMAAARVAAKELVGRLAPTDDFSLVAFASEAEVKVVDGPVGPRRATILRAIDGLQATGGTNISGGLELGYQQARSSTIPSEALRVVLLMSDGKPNGGTTNREDLSRLALGAFQDGVQTSAFGLGTDYDGALMSALASDGAGGYYYVAKPDQIAQALSTELDRRLDPVALGVEVRVRLKDDVKLLGVYGSRRLGEREAAKVRAQEIGVDVQAAAKQHIKRDRQDDAEGGMRFFMPAFGRDDAHAILLKLDLPAGVGERGIASIEVKYKDLLRHDNHVDERSLKATWADSDAASAASVDRSMLRSIQSFAAGQALSQAAIDVQRGNLDDARRRLAERQGILEQAAVTLGDPSLAVDAGRLRRLHAFLEPGSATSDPLALAMLVETAGQTRLR